MVRCGKLESVGERVLGSELQPPGNEKEKGVYPGTLGLVVARLDELERLLDLCHRKANRLTQL